MTAVEASDVLPFLFAEAEAHDHGIQDKHAGFVELPGFPQVRTVFLIRIYQPEIT